MASFINKNYLTCFRIGDKKINIFSVKSIIRSILNKFSLSEFLLNHTKNKTNTTFYKGKKYVLSTPNRICKYRAETFSTKEPETLEWIDDFVDKSIFWDIGANVGLYSIYAASQKYCHAYAFEPSVFNLEILARNISLNGLSGSIKIIPLAISDKTGFGKFTLSTTEWGGALSTFDKTYGYDGNMLNSKFEYYLGGMTMDEVVSKFQVPFPDYLKIDVDGIEHLILQGGTQVLSLVKSVLIEISVNFQEQKNESQRCLEAAGLKLMHGHIDETSQETVNQIWVRPE